MCVWMLAAFDDLGGWYPMPVAKSAFHVFLTEFLGTLALVFVIINVAAIPSNSDNSFYGLAIGLTVFGMASTFMKAGGL